MSISEYFTTKCFDATRDNIKLALDKLSQPKDLVSFDVSQGLEDAYKKAMSGDLYSAVEGLAKNNLDSIAVGLLSVIPEDNKFFNKIKGTMDTVYSYASTAFLAGNAFVVFLMQQAAANCISKIDAKTEKTKKIDQYLDQMIDALEDLKSAPSELFDTYLQSLRSAIGDLDQAYFRVRSTRSGLQTRNIYLSNLMDQAQDYVVAAKSKITANEADPFENGKEQAGQAALDAVGLSSFTTEIEKLQLVPTLSANIIGEMREYALELSAVNGLLATIIYGESALVDVLVDLASIQVQKILSDIENNILNLSDSMKDSLFGDRPGGGTQKLANAAKVTAMAVSWNIRAAEIVTKMNLVPTDKIQELNRRDETVEPYLTAISELKKLDDVGTGLSVLKATDAQEEVALFEQQMLTFLSLANGSLSTFTISQGTIELARSLKKRTELTLIRDEQIKSILQEFVDSPLNDTAYFNRVIGGINDILETAGLDRALDLWQKGKYEEFFSMSPRAATFVGAGLQALALLKNCFETEEERATVESFQRELEREEDLVNIKIDLDFDVAIRVNLEECVRVEALARIFNLQEFLCGLAESAGENDIFAGLESIVNFGN